MPLSRAFAIGQALVFNNATTISVCPQPGCGVLTVINPVHMAFTEHGFCCAECTRKNPSSNGLATCSWITQLGIGTQSWSLTAKPKSVRVTANKIKKEQTSAPLSSVSPTTLLENQLKITCCAVCGKHILSVVCMRPISYVRYRSHTEGIVVVMFVCTGSHISNASQIEQSIVFNTSCRVLVCTRHSQDVVKRLRELVGTHQIKRSATINPECAREGVCICLSAHTTCTGHWNPATLRNAVATEHRDTTITKQAEWLHYNENKLRTDPRAKQFAQRQRQRSRASADQQKR